MEEIESETREKQDLLHTEIIDKNLNKEEFIKFCLTKKEGGDDINNWTLEELKEIINEFVSQSEEKKNIENKENLFNSEKKEKDNEENPKVIKEQTIKCRKLLKTALNDKKITVTIKNPKEMDGGLFGKKYILYEVKTAPMGWTVLRRFSDFDLFRTLFTRYFPSYIVPFLPSKKIGNKRFEKNFINKRMKFLNLFINKVVEREEFKTSELLIAFLSITDRAKFEAKFKEFQTRTLSAYIEDYKTFDGTLSITYDEENDKNLANMSKYFKFQSELFQKLNKCIKTFYNNMTKACEALEEVHKFFDVIYYLNMRFFMNKTITKNFEEFKFFFENWKNVLIKQKEMVKTNIKDFYKFINMEDKAYIEVLDKRDELKNKYDAEVIKVNDKKEKLFATNDINKFELGVNHKVDRDRVIKDKEYAFKHMCLLDNLNLKIMENQLGYANKMSAKELDRMLNEHCTRIVENVRKFDSDFYPTINDMLGTWTNMEKFVMSTKGDSEKVNN
jgi:hypothetical protein